MGLADFFSAEAGQKRRRWLEESLGYYVPPELEAPLTLANMLNPVANIEDASRASQTMLAPDTSGWGRVAAAGDMATNIAAVAGPAAVAKAAGMPAYQAVEEGLLGMSSVPREEAARFMADEFGGVPVPFSGDETTAQKIARMLSSGRASEVTDEMMAKADPVEMMALYKAGATGQDMPMDVASRMARAEAMGFDTGTPLYHGTAADFPAFKASENGKFGGGVYTSPEPSMAEKYMEYQSGDYNVIPVFNQGDRLNLDGAFSADQKSRLRLPKRVSQPDDMWPPSITADQYYADLDKRMVRGGYTAKEYGAPYQEVVTMDPRNIRSRFARFDPRLKHLSNLSAGIGALGLWGLMQPPGE
jgi:hypothetical protein